MSTGREVVRSVRPAAPTTKGQCLPTENAAVIAFTTRFGARPSPAALLCRPSPPEA
ncbi:hypothetical protein [Streptomyces olivochromogenes]|uniref:hypothetical protein n=1 Tax=Streptomyces olivochromogenes TaxID=1963 RepID=UPI001F28E258|nr:hypothetical protein [Streptomyces olivochromogenes]MCF3133189.1 hypothetical protein [Streptomyces olivochromogenes]